MALIPCPHCGRQISSKAERCPHCGNTILIEKKYCDCSSTLDQCSEDGVFMRNSTKDGTLREKTAIRELSDPSNKKEISNKMSNDKTPQSEKYRHLTEEEKNSRTIWAFAFIIIATIIAILMYKMFFVFSIIILVLAVVIAIILLRPPRIDKDEVLNEDGELSESDKRKLRIILGTVLAIVVIIAGVIIGGKIKEKKEQEKVLARQEQITKQKSLEEQKRLQEEQARIERDRRDAEKKQMEKEQLRKNIERWLEGEWVVTDGDVSLRFVVKNGYGTFIESYFGNVGEGRIVVNVDAGTIECGASTLKFDYNDNNKTLYSNNFRKFSRVSSSGRQNYSSSTNTYSGMTSSHKNSAWDVSEFLCEADVINYTSSHKFVGRNGTTININFNGLYINGQLVSSVPRVTYYSGTRATILCTAPGWSTFRISVDASQGVLSESGDTYFAK